MSYLGEEVHTRGYTLWYTHATKSYGNLGYDL